MKHRIFLVFSLLISKICFSQIEFNSQDPNFFQYYGAPNSTVYNTIQDALTEKYGVYKLKSVNENLQKSISKISKLRELQVLYLENNQLNMLPTELSTLGNLFILVSKKNPIQYVSPMLSECRSLMYVELWGTKLDSFPSVFQFMPSLELIRILGNESKDTMHVSDSIKAIRGLRSLQLAEVQLYEFPSFISESNELEVIDLVNCKLDSLPSSIQRLSRLKSLNLTENQIVQIPSEIYKMKNLEVLNLSKNKLSNIAEWVAYMPNLQVLDITGNMIPLQELEILHLLFKAKGKMLYSDLEKIQGKDLQKK
jgi:Leucine-rich repeat (LRR) protein